MDVAIGLVLCRWRRWQGVRIKPLTILPRDLRVAADCRRLMGWLKAIRSYLVVTAALDLVWEAMQLPMYAIWTQGTAVSRAFAVLHCTGGDLLIALAVLIGVLLAVRDPAWPRRHQARVAIATVLAGLAYTVFSEWLNVARGNWSYSALMPVLPPFGTGLLPVLQWIVVPSTALWICGRAGARAYVQAAP